MLSQHIVEKRQKSQITTAPLDSQGELLAEQTEALDSMLADAVGAIHESPGFHRCRFISNRTIPWSPRRVLRLEIRQPCRLCEKR